MAPPNNPIPLIVASSAPFTFTPSQFGGRKARKGLAFQDWWIAHALVSALVDTQTFFFARVEGVEDLDLVSPGIEETTERYYQVKSMSEGSGSWTLGKLEKEGVVSRFADLFARFEDEGDPKRKLELIAVLEGDVNKELLNLPVNCDTSARSHFESILATAAVLRRIPALKAKQHAVWSVFASAGPDFSEQYFRSTDLTSINDCGESQNIRNTICEAGDYALAKLGSFLQCFRIESRAPSAPHGASRILEHAIISRLTQIADITPEEAKRAVQSLVKNIGIESALSEPTIVDRNLVLSWLELTPKPALQSRPGIVSDFVERSEFLTQIKAFLESDRILHIYGIPKIGKSQIASRFIELQFSEDDYVWFTFTNDQSDRLRLVREISTWLGKRYGIWQVFDDMRVSSPEDPRFWERVSNAVKKPLIFVLDEFHRGDNSAILKAFKSLPVNGQVTLLLVSETKSSSTEALGINQLAVPGLSPKEALLLLMKQGINPQDALLETTAMSIQFGGHPLMLKAICQLLSKRPTGKEVQNASENLPHASSVTAFLGDLSNKVFFNLIRTNEQRNVFSRLAVLSSHFDKRLALALATVNPAVAFTAADWTLLASTILDASGPDRYLIPPIMKHIAEEALDPNVSKEGLLVSAARTYLTPKSPTQPLDFLDFQSAILAFFSAKKYQTAAYVFGNAVPALLEVADYEQLQLMFWLLNSPPIQAVVKDNMLRWRLLMGECIFLIKDRKAARTNRGPELLKQMRSIAAQVGKRKWFLKITLLGIAASFRGRRINPESPSPKAPLRLIAPILTALRIAIKADASDQIQSLAKFIGSVMRWAPFADVLVLDALSPLLPHIVRAGFAPNRVIELYMRVVFSPAKGGKYHKKNLLQHAAEFDSQGFVFGYVAAMYAVAHIASEYENDFVTAREIGETLLSNLGKLNPRHALIARMRMLVGDTFWKEKNYSESAIAYAQALEGHNIKIVRESALIRLLDSWIELKKFDDVTSRVIRELRRRHCFFDHNTKSQLYGRLAYALAENGDLMKAAISCHALDRLGQQSKSDEIRRRALLVAGWALDHFKFDDVALPHAGPFSLDSKDISDQPTDLQLQKWREGDPTATKARLQISTMYELLGRYKKALALIREAVRDGEQYPNPKLYVHVLGIRETRLMLMLKMLKPAAARFRDLLVADIGDTGTARDLRAYAIWRFLEPKFSDLTDDQVIKFSDELCSIVPEWPDVQAAVKLHLARALFDRFLVQKARHCLAEAESLAATAKASATLCWSLKEKLFLRAHQIFRNWDSWIVGMAEAILGLNEDFVAESIREDFASAARAFADHNKNAFHQRLRDLDQTEPGKPLPNVAKAVLQFATARSLSSDALVRLGQAVGKSSSTLA